MTLYTFKSAIYNLDLALSRRAKLVHTEKWQGTDISKKPEMATYELKHVFFQCDMQSEDLDYYRGQITPNLPWADEHFEKERVIGEPLNPGTTWRQWPHAHSADKFRTVDEHKTGELQFNHTYAERYWPKHAAMYPDGIIDHDFDPQETINCGIRYNYGDLNDVVAQLVREPYTRQAVLPVFFPEDTGAVHGGRVPCSLYYHFLVRPGDGGGDRIDISYTIRSCDWTRHFRDDLYLTVRLLLWVLEECRKRDERWLRVSPGTFAMLITSLHVFRNDYLMEFGS